MAVADTVWLRYNQGHYVKADVGEQINLSIELKNELDTGDFLQGCVATTTSSGLTIFGATVRFDSDRIDQPHQQMVVVIPTAVGTHDVKLVSTTQNGLTIVKHFDILTER